jgi:hypothetical protein
MTMGLKKRVEGMETHWVFCVDRVKIRIVPTIKIQQFNNDLATKFHDMSISIHYESQYIHDLRDQA